MFIFITSESGNFRSALKIASNISFFAFSVNVIHRMSSGSTPFSSKLITFRDSVNVLPVPGFETTMVSPFDSMISFCSGDGLISEGLDLVMLYSLQDQEILHNIHP